MAGERIDETGATPEDARTERRSYVWGYVLSLLLTAPGFALVAWGGLGPTAIGWIIGVAALVQIVVHFRCFLHIRLQGQAWEDLQLILFTTLILAMMAGGTIWILSNLAERMM